MSAFLRADICSQYGVGRKDLLILVTTQDREMSGPLCWPGPWNSINRPFGTLYEAVNCKHEEGVWKELEANFRE